MAVQSQCAPSERRQVEVCLRALPVSDNAVVDISSRNKCKKWINTSFF